MFNPCPSPRDIAKGIETQSLRNCCATVWVEMLELWRLGMREIVVEILEVVGMLNFVCRLFDISHILS